MAKPVSRFDDTFPLLEEIQYKAPFEVAKVLIKVKERDLYIDNLVCSYIRNKYKIQDVKFLFENFNNLKIKGSNFNKVFYPSSAVEELWDGDEFILSYGNCYNVNVGEWYYNNSKEELCELWKLKLVIRESSVHP